MRKKGKHFKGKLETCAKPMFRDGKLAFSMIKDVRVVFGKMIKDVRVVFGKGRGSQQVPNDENGRAPMWKKKSILWELPY